MPRKPFGAGLPRWASGKACPTKATPTITPWRRTFSAASNLNGSTCANMAPAVLLKRIFSPILRPFTIRCARILPLTGSHRALLNCACVMPLPPDLRDFTYYCDSFRFFALFTVYFFGRGSPLAKHAPFYISTKLFYCFQKRWQPKFPILLKVSPCHKIGVFGYIFWHSTTPDFELTWYRKKLRKQTPPEPMAEMERFELSRVVSTPTAFRVRTLQPLGYISIFSCCLENLSILLAFRLLRAHPDARKS